MPKHFSCPPQYLLFSLSIIFLTSTSYAGTYKWTDANGQAHYSDKKPDAGQTKVDEVKVRYSHDIAQVPQYKPNTMEFQRSQEQKNESDDSSQSNKKSKPAWGGDQLETDDTRCALGRAIVSGVAKHRNGTPLDDYDKKTAQNDILKYCH